MASGYSQPGSTYRHLNPVDVFDEQLVATVLGAKQQRYDKNLAAIDAALAEYGQVDLARTKDKKYLQDRLQSLTDQVNNSGMQDLSSSAVARSINQHIDQALDDNLLEQMANTQKIRKFGADIAEYKKKNDGSYAKQNEAYALHQAGFTEYMGGSTDSLGGLEYNPYVDVAKTQKEILDDAFTVDKGITRKLPDGKGHYIESTHYGLTPSEVRAKVSANLNPQELKQLEIDAWAKYGEQAPQRYEEYVSPKLAELKEERESLMLNYDGLTKAEKASVDAKVAAIDSTSKEISSLKDSTQSLYRFLGKEDLIGGLSSMYSPVETNLSYSTDTAYYKEQENMQNMVSAATGRQDHNNDGVSDITNRALATDFEDNHIPTEKAEQEIKDYQWQMRGVFNQAYNRLPEDKQEAFNTGYKKYLEQNELSDNPANKTAFMLKQGVKGDYFTPEEWHTAKNMEREYQERLKIKNDNYLEALEEQEAQSLETVFRGLKDDTENSGILVLDENGNKVSARDFLRGVESVGDLSESKKKTLLKSVYADITLSQTKDHNTKGGVNAKTAYNISRLAKVNGEVGRDLPMLLHPRDVILSGYKPSKFKSDFEGLKKDMQLPEGMTKKQFETHIMPLIDGESPGKLLEGLNETPIIGGLGRIVETTMVNMTREFGIRSVSDNMIIGGEGTKTREDLEKALKAGLYDEPSPYDDSVEDDAEIRGALDNRDSFRQSYEAKMAADANNFDVNQEIIVQASGSRKGETVAAFEDLRRFAPFEKGKAIYVRKSSIDGMYDIYQPVKDSTTVKNGEQIDKSEVISATVAEEALVGEPFWENIKKQKSARRITSENTKELISNNTGFADEKDQRKYVVGLAKALGTSDEKYLSRFTSQGAKQSLIDNHQSLFSDDVAGERFKGLVKNVVDNSHLFRLNVQANDLGKFDMAIQYPTNKDGKQVWKNLKVMPTGTSDITETVKLIDMAPQAFIYEYMNRLLTNIEQNGSESVEDDLKLLTTIIYPQ